MNTVEGNLQPLHAKVLVTDMEFGMEKTMSGIILLSDDGKSAGIHPRWAKVFAVGPDQTDVKVGDWILVEHGRWTRGINLKRPDGEEILIRMVENKSIIMSSPEKPEGAEQRHRPVGAGSNFNFNIPGM